MNLDIETNKITITLSKGDNLQQIVNHLQFLTKYAPNGLDDYFETYSEILIQGLKRYEQGSQGLMAERIHDEGHFAPDQLARELAREFEHRNKGRIWGGEGNNWFDAIEEFITEKNL